MPLSADRCQVTWGPNPLKRAEVGRGGGCVYARECVGAYSHTEWVCACMYSMSARGLHSSASWVI